MVGTQLEPIHLHLDRSNASFLAGQASAAARGFIAATPGSMLAGAALWAQLESLASALRVLPESASDETTPAQRAGDSITLEAVDAPYGVPEGFTFQFDAAGALDLVQYRDTRPSVGLDVVTIAKRADGWDVVSSIPDRAPVYVDVTGAAKAVATPGDRMRRRWRGDPPPASPDVANWETEFNRSQLEMVKVQGELEAHEQKMSALSGNIATLLARQAGDLAALAKRKAEEAERIKREAEAKAPAQQPAVEWHYLDSGSKPVGPVPEAELRRMLAEGALPASTMVWRAGLDTWQTAETQNLLPPEADAAATIIQRPVHLQPPPAGDWTATAITPEGPGRTFNIQNGDIAGRSPDCPIPVPIPTSSRNHARFDIALGRLYVTDLGSANGTRVNGERISGQAELHDGDRVFFADYEMLIRHAGAPEPPAPEPVTEALVDTVSPTSHMSSWKTCPACYTENPARGRFCRGCGRRLD